MLVDVRPARQQDQPVLTRELDVHLTVQIGAQTVCFWLQTEQLAKFLLA
jgi:hypothetical protein